MVTIVAVDSLSQPSNTTSTANSGTKNGLFANTLQQAQTDASKESVKAEEQKVSSTISEDTSSDKDTQPLTLEFLLPSAKVEEQKMGEEVVDFSALFQITDLQKLIASMGGQQLAEGEQLSMQNVAQALGMTEKELQSLVMKLTDQVAPTTDLWDALNQIDSKLNAVLQNIASAMKGHGDAKLTKQEAKSAIALLKVIELAGPRTDLLLKQELTVSQTKEWLSNLATQAPVKSAQVETTLPFAKTLMKFQLNQSEQPTQQATSVNSVQPTAVPKTTFSIVLPANATPQSQSAKFVEEFQNVMNRAQFASNAAGTRLLIKLYPENLGTIRIELVQKDGMLSAKLLASNALGKQMLDSTLHQLKQGFTNQNIQLDRIDVAQALSEPSKGERGQQFGQQTSHQNQKEDEEQQSSQEQLKSFDQLLAEMEES